MRSDLADDFQHTMDRALFATQRGELEEAERLLGDAALLRPRSGLPHFLMAANFAERGSIDLAEAAYIACISRAPDLRMARFQLGLLQLTTGRAAAARSTWEPLLGLDGDASLKCFAQGMLEISSGNTATGEGLVLQGLSLNRDNAALARDMQGVLSRLSRRLADDSAAGLAPARAAALDRPDDETASQAHFLISGYRRQ